MCRHKPDAKASKTMSLVTPGEDFHVPKPIQPCGVFCSVVFILSSSLFPFVVSSSASLISVGVVVGIPRVENDSRPGGDEPTRGDDGGDAERSGDEFLRAVRELFRAHKT